MIALDVGQVQFAYEPYPIGVAKPVLAADLYDQLVDAFPPIDLFQFKENIGRKYSLSEVNNPQQYNTFLNACKSWRKFYFLIKSQDFIAVTLKTLQVHGIDLGLLDKLDQLSSRFEFSAIPAAGGYLRPHTDIPSKVATVVISMVRPGEWDRALGGGTAIMKAKDPRKSFSHIGHYKHGFDDFETVRTLEHEPNQAILFVKTWNSWHAVEPLRGPEGSPLLRRSVTINIERVAR